MGATLLPIGQTPAADAKANVAFILADNVGYGDLGPYGGGELREAPTPRIDQLAREGPRLAHYPVEPACTPSHVALMRGGTRLATRCRCSSFRCTPNTLSGRAVTMDQLFKGEGYATAIFGKSHLGSESQSVPTAHGFDEYYGIPPSHGTLRFTSTGSKSRTPSRRRAMRCWPAGRI